MTEVDDSGVDCGASFCVARPLILVDDVCNLEQISDVVAAQNAFDKRRRDEDASPPALS
jgi:hypothetical protein